MDNIRCQNQFEDLVSRINNGDKKAFEKLYRTYYSDLCDFICRYIDTPAICEELVQDLFLSIWYMRESWNPKGSLRAYLFKGAKNRALDYLKHLKVERGYLKDQKINFKNEYLADYTYPSFELHSKVEDSEKELAEKIEKAIDRLPDRGKLIFNLSRNDGLTFREIANVLDISVKTVETQMGRNLKKLRYYLSDYLPGLVVMHGYFQCFL